ncbi:hypothetical protein CURTO8I2_60119 [Curtobacterium sp. 8I-2]|nr:hypothetical protein CURTO8I2_60119 [Curtobacterium sp. 8I-2]
MKPQVRPCNDESNRPRTRCAAEEKLAGLPPVSREKSPLVRSEQAVTPRNFENGTFRIPKGPIAEGVGFEPTRHLCPPVFKTGSIGRSDNPPVTRPRGET